MAKPKNHAIIENGVVVNVIWVREAQAKEFSAVLLPNDAAGIGWRYENGEFFPPEIQAESAPEE